MALVPNFTDSEEKQAFSCLAQKQTLDHSDPSYSRKLAPRKEVLALFVNCAFAWEVISKMVLVTRASTLRVSSSSGFHSNV
mmetsp:Transcript_39737/g.99481  ORF Transcript_39737/g.99481 Transcript_39737/m.99481 type:complete len:81 (-) Transcript_39737:174-416(-)